MGITQKRLKELFEYRKDGNLLWKSPQSKRMNPGDLAGCPDSSGYWRIRFDGKRQRLHRLVWIFHHGKCPNILDHINRDRRDSRIENLRPASRVQNIINRNSYKVTRSGYKGVAWNNNQNKWVARIGFNKKRKNLGYFSKKQDAAIAYNKAAVAMYGEFASLNKIRK